MVLSFTNEFLKEIMKMLLEKIRIFDVSDIFALEFSSNEVEGKSMIVFYQSFINMV